jgi:hypothetical protein
VSVFALLADVLLEPFAAGWPHKATVLYALRVLNIQEEPGRDEQALACVTEEELQAQRACFAHYVLSDDECEMVQDFVLSFKVDSIMSGERAFTPGIEFWSYAAFRFFLFVLDDQEKFIPRLDLLEGLGFLCPNFSQTFGHYLDAPEEHGKIRRHRKFALSVHLRPITRALPRTKREMEMELFMLVRDYERRGYSKIELLIFIISQLQKPTARELKSRVRGKTGSTPKTRTTR